jgi:hypothetical protein
MLLRPFERIRPGIASTGVAFVSLRGILLLTLDNKVMIFIVGIRQHGQGIQP